MWSVIVFHLASETHRKEKPKLIRETAGATCGCRAALVLRLAASSRAADQHHPAQPPCSRAHLPGRPPPPPLPVPVPVPAPAAPPGPAAPRGAAPPAPWRRRAAGGGAVDGPATNGGRGHRWLPPLKMASGVGRHGSCSFCRASARPRFVAALLPHHSHHGEPLEGCVWPGPGGQGPACLPLPCAPRSWLPAVAMGRLR